METVRRKEGETGRRGGEEVEGAGADEEGKQGKNKGKSRKWWKWGNNGEARRVCSYNSEGRESESEGVGTKGHVVARFYSTHR